MTKKIRIKIDGKEYLASAEQTVLDVAKKNKIFVPSLCHHPDLKVKANCRVCTVELKGTNKLQSSCSLKVREGLDVLTNSKKVQTIRNTNLKLLFAEHVEKCATCTLRFNCALLDLAKRYNIKITNFKDRKGNRETYKFGNAVEIDGTQCINCRNCVDVCKNIQKIGYLEIKGKGINQEIVPTEDKKIDCIYCGQCTTHCPVASAQEQASWPQVEKVLQKGKEKKMIAVIAPSTRMTIGEEFGMPYGQDNSGKMIAALKQLGFSEVIDVDFSADVTTLVEAGELLERLGNKKAKLPMITSCCPAWVKYLEFYRPDLIPHLTTSRSPQIQLGGIIKTYWAKKKNIKAEDIYVVSIMPCTSKKFEITRPELKIGKLQPVDEVLTVRELAYLIKKNNIDFKNLKPVKSNDIFNDGSSAGLIYGASGGVMESALRTASYALCHSKKSKICRSRLEFKDVRGYQGVKETTVNLNGHKLRIGVISGIGNVKDVLINIDKYDYMEVMACPGGCIGGGGQPIPSSKEIIEKRTAGIYKIDSSSKLRTAHDNLGAVEVVKWLKDNNLTQKVLHTKYSKKTRK